MLSAGSEVQGGDQANTGALSGYVGSGCFADCCSQTSGIRTRSSGCERLVSWFWTSFFPPGFQLLMPRPCLCRLLLRLLGILLHFEPLQPRPCLCRLLPRLLWCSPQAVPTLRGCPSPPSSPLEVPTLRGSSAGLGSSNPWLRRLVNGSASRLRRMTRRSWRKLVIRS